MRGQVMKTWVCLFTKLHNTTIMQKCPWKITVGVKRTSFKNSFGWTFFFKNKTSIKGFLLPISSIYFYS